MRRHAIDLASIKPFALSGSSRLSHSAIWFQLAKMPLTSSKPLIPQDRNHDPRLGRASVFDKT